MAEQRLIDANELYGVESLLNTDIVKNSKEASYIISQVLHDIQTIPTIDPETLPIVRQLREELEKVTAERDAAIKTIFEWSGCAECKQWDGENEWCKKHDREADSCDGCDTPEWRGTQKEE